MICLGEWETACLKYPSYFIDAFDITQLETTL